MASPSLIGRPGRALVLVGFMGAGKSTAARTLASDALDTDAMVEAELGAPVATIFERDGESSFREAEERCALKALNLASAGQGGGIVSLGGGALLSPVLREALKAHTVVHLELDEEGCWSRVRSSSFVRPLAADRERFGALYEERRSLYSDAADVVLPSDGVRSLRAAMPSIDLLSDAPDGTRLAWASSDSGAYPVFVGQRLLAAKPLRPEGRFVLITDSNVAPLHAEAFTGAVNAIELEPGEENKDLEACAHAWSQLAQAGVTRDDRVFALGGGVVGDIAGFVAAAYQRGIPVVHFPTTLVAQVDSALGGKTGVDLPEGKNYVGAYHQPAAVISDFDVLRTLPAEEHSAGMAEVIKTALISGGPLWDSVAAGRFGISEVFECVRTKLSVVASDERDGGRRQVLNLGHTVAHAIETATGYGRLRHGEAVSIGLMAALRLSGADELRNTVADLLVGAGLPLTISGVDCDEIVALTKADKKARADGTVPFVLCDRPGNATHGHPVPDAELRAAVKEVCR
ncbi:MAG: bifunctional shikimate kinase/3-dehydroquinate synthase [Actinomycetes bacterium]